LSVSGASLRAMNVEIPLFVLKLSGKIKPRYLVLQTKATGLSNTEVVVYADVFYRRSQAEKAVKAANDRLGIKIRNVTIGSRRGAQLVTLPTDSR
jgi:hypothetical protein